RFVYPELASFSGDLFAIIQGFAIIGGIITLIGTAIVSFNVKVGKYLILVSGIVAGGNLLTIFGAILLTKKFTTQKQERLPYICASCGEFSHTFAKYCENCGTKGSLRKAMKSDYELFLL
ncbi:MAG: hypothetical protein ACFE8B_14885, partial [Candidatus Hermodarchaeota archaeon]